MGLFFDRLTLPKLLEQCAQGLYRGFNNLSVLGLNCSGLRCCLLLRRWQGDMSLFSRFFKARLMT